MNQETATLHSLGEVDPELARKIELDIDRVVNAYIERNLSQIGGRMLQEHMSVIERLALRAIKNHFNNASNIY